MTASTQAATHASCWPSRSSSARGASGRAPPGGASHPGAPRGDAALSRSPLHICCWHAANVTLADIHCRRASRLRCASVVFDAGWLGVDGVEDLIATAGIADHQLWFVLGELPSPELADLLRAHFDPW